MHYASLVEIYAQLEKTTKRLEKTHIISEFLKKIKEDEIKDIILLLQGKLFQEFDETKIGVASRLVIKAISLASGITPEKVEEEWKKTGDLGIVSQNLIKAKKQNTLFSRDLSVKKVIDNLRKLATLEGAGSVDQKVQLIAELLTSAKPEEARYIVRTVLEDLRVGVAAGTLRDAIVWTYLFPVPYSKEEKILELENREEYNKAVQAVQDAYNKVNDFGEVALAAKKGLKALESISMQLGSPIQVMLAQKENTIAEAFAKVGKPAALEFKYDGFRMLIHKDKNSVMIFTRRLENVTRQFPEVASYVKENVHADSAIIDCEGVGFDAKTNKYLPFQNISQRIRRKYDIDELAKKMPVELNVFDVIFYNGKSMIDELFEKRRKLLEKIISQKQKKIVLARQIITADEKEARKFFEESVKLGNEGVMFKNLKGMYKIGSRVGYMVKYKSAMETLDLVIVGAEWGEGKRSGWLTSFNLACKDGDEFMEIGKVGTGVKELEAEGLSFKELTESLKPLIISEKGREVRVKPKVILEIKYEEIQKSPSYSSGYALRFPRVLRERTMEKGLKDVSDIEMVKLLFKGQKK
ncbi:MAG: ATP-dependent DNA ligase [Nanoarchaeota archaeon]